MNPFICTSACLALIVSLSAIAQQPAKGTPPPADEKKKVSAERQKAAQKKAVVCLNNAKLAGLKEGTREHEGSVRNCLKS
jgi:hypothetical protein